MADQITRALRAEGAAVDFLPINPKPPGVLALAEKVKVLRTAVVSAFYCASLIRRLPHYDVIHLFSASYFSFLIAQMPAILIARLYRKPVILNYRSGEARDHLTRATPFVHGLIGMCRRIVVPSGYLVEVFAEFGFHAEAIANVVDPTEFRPRERATAHPRVLVPRTLDPLYDVGCAIRAFEIVKERCPAAELTILGDGAEEKRLRQLVADLALRDVNFAGRVPRAEIGAVYDRHDILLNTSAVDNMPVSLLEGFAAGLPIVSTDAGGIPFIIRDGENGYLVAVGDHAEAAERVLALIEDADDLKRLSRASLEEAKRYRWDGIGRQWRALYAEVAGSRGAMGSSGRTA